MNKKRRESLRSQIGEFSDESDFFSKKPTVGKYKAKQLCKQVERNLGVIFSTLENVLLRDLYVLAVEPAPDSSRLLVILGANEQVEIHVINEALKNGKGYIRSEIARAIHRKKVPELCFEVLDGGQLVND